MYVCEVCGYVKRMRVENAVDPIPVDSFVTILLSSPPSLSPLVLRLRTATGPLSAAAAAAISSQLVRNKQQDWEVSGGDGQRCAGWSQGEWGERYCQARSLGFFSREVSACMCVCVRGCVCMCVCV